MGGSNLRRAGTVTGAGPKRVIKPTIGHPCAYSPLEFSLTGGMVGFCYFREATCAATTPPVWLPPRGGERGSREPVPGIPSLHLRQIIDGRRRITADIARRLALTLGTTPLYWMSLQTRYDLDARRPRVPAKAEPQSGAV